MYARADRINTVITILGMKGSGKSALILGVPEKKISGIIQDWNRVIIFDPNAEYEGDVYWTRNDAVQALLSHEKKKRFRLVFRLHRIEDALSVLHVCYEMPDTLVVLDETSLYCSSSHMPDEVARLIRFGRHRRISLIFAARRPSELPRDLTANSDIIISFKQHEKRDIEYLKSILGEKAEKVKHLKRYRFFCYGPKDKAPLALLERYNEMKG